MEEDEESSRLLPLKDVQTMRDRIRFRNCPRFGVVPLMHFCEYCDPDDEPQPSGALSLGTQQSLPSSSTFASYAGEHPLVSDPYATVLALGLDAPQHSRNHLP